MLKKSLNETIYSVYFFIVKIIMDLFEKLNLKDYSRIDNISLTNRLFNSNLLKTPKLPFD